VLPDARPLTDDDAEAWLAAGIPRWVTRHLPAALWVVTFVVAVATDNTQCTPADPSVCGPDYLFPWFAVIALATPILLFWMPLLGCAAGIAYALAELRYDPAALPRVAYAAHGLVCLVVAVLLLRSRRAQRQVMARRGATTRISAQDINPGWSLLRIAVAVLLVPVAAVSFWWYHRVSTAESRHVARAETVTAQVVAASSDDSTITIQVDQGLDDPRKIVVDVLDTQAYRVGGTTPVLLDPQDRSWQRLVAEPYDPTGWEIIGLGALALMALLVGRDLQRRRAIRLITSTAQPCVQVRTSWLELEALLFTTESDTTSFGELCVVQPPPREGYHDHDDVDARDATFGEFWRGERHLEGLAWDEYEGLVEVPGADARSVEPAVLVGALYDGGWAVLVTSEGVLLPERPLRLNGKPGRSFHDLLAKAPGRFRRAPEPPDEGEIPGVPAVAGDDVAAVGVPSAARPLVRTRLIGRLWILLAFVAAPTGVLWLAESWFQRGLAVLMCGQLLLAGCRRSGQELRLSHEHLEVVGAWNTLQVPWERLHGARRDGEVLLLAWEPDFVIALGPLELEGPSQGPEAVAQTVGATVVRMRERALAVGHPNRQIRRLPGSARGLFAAYGLLCLAALWLVR
jgi:hypothetical protein